jgi:predicted enzyme related to lactoylglutathione lyase
MARVNHFEIPADKPERATKFYQQVFGWTVRKWDGPQDYWLVSTGKTPEPGIDGAIVQRSAVPTTTNTVSVPSVDEFVKKVTSAGGKVLTPKTVVPGQGYMAYVADTEGNRFGLMQMDMKAK